MVVVPFAGAVVVPLGLASGILSVLTGSLPFAAANKLLARELAGMGVELQTDQTALTSLENRWQALGTNPPAAQAQALYLDARWLVRRIVLANPLLDFDRLQFVKRFTQESYPDVCLNHMPWVSRPGGDICVLSGAEPGKLFPRLAEPESAVRKPAGALAAPAPREGSALFLKSILNRALGPGHVHGMDLWWGGDRVVFGYAKAKRDAPAEGCLDRTKSYQLRRTEEPIHIFEVATDGSFNIKDDEEADEVWNRLGGLGGVLDKFQMVEDEEYRRNFDETRNFIEGLRNPKLRGGGQLDENKKELEKAV